MVCTLYPDLYEKLYGDKNNVWGGHFTLVVTLLETHSGDAGRNYHGGNTGITSTVRLKQSPDCDIIYTHLNRDHKSILLD